MEKTRSGWCFFTLFCVLWCFVVTSVVCQTPASWSNSESSVSSPSSSSSASAIPTDHPGGRIEDTLYFALDQSPYRILDDIIIEEKAQMIVAPGVELRFQPQIGITVRGKLTAVGNQTHRITMTTVDKPYERQDLPEIRLVDGPSILAGRVQIKHLGKWRSVCTNSRNWTEADMHTACRQMGFQGGSFFSWFNREMPVKSRLLYEEPKCRGIEPTIKQCEWETRQLGGGVCDYHPDLGIQCLPRHDNPQLNWRGIRFENAKSSNVLTQRNSLYIPISNSKLEYINILYAGNGRNHNTTSALEVLGVPPIISHVDVLNSVYNGINITEPYAPISIKNSRFRNNRGYGVFINSSFGLAEIENSLIGENGGDGIRYVHNEDFEDRYRLKELPYDFCTLATVASQPYPVYVSAEQTIFSTEEKNCPKTFTTNYGQQITLNFIHSITDKNDTAFVDVYDGSSSRQRLIKSVPVRNYTRPQSLTSTGNQIFIKFRAQPGVNLRIYMRLTAGVGKTADLKINHCEVSENFGRGIVFDNLRTLLYVNNSTVAKNGHVGGLHVTSGVGDINVTSSDISFNEGDGINITYTGGSRNISRCSINSNKGYGIAVWLNNTEKTEYLYANQTTVVQYSQIMRNLEIGVLHGNFCEKASINVTGNTFYESLSDALEILSCWKQSNSSTILQIGHNKFTSNKKLSIKISPALNLQGNIEYNWITKGEYGGLLIKNKPLEEFNSLPVNLAVQNNHFRENSGVFVISLNLSPYSEKQYLLFTKNFVKDNFVNEPFSSSDDLSLNSKLNPRSRVAAPVVIGSNNVEIYRNIIDNPASKYELGSHLEDQSKDINCTFNWLGSAEEKRIFHKIFHRSDRYNLARIQFVPYLLHNSNPSTSKFNTYQLYVPYFTTKDSNTIGGEIEGEEHLPQGEYFVEKDINIRPSGKLIVEPGVTLYFPPSVGMMVGGRLEARGIRPDSIRLTLKEEIPSVNDTYESETESEFGEIQTEIITEAPEPKVPIRLLGGVKPTEGRLQVKIDNEWGTVCNYGWTLQDAALACHQLGLVLNVDDWNLERSEIPNAGTTERVVLSNVECSEFDLDLTKCKADKLSDFENSCSHENDVGIRCYESSWAGVRFGSLSQRSDIQFLTIEKSGLLDYATNSFKPALQLDFSRHNFESIKITNNFHDGLGIMYSDIYKDESVNTIKNSEFTFNKGAGISFKQLGLKIHGSKIENNAVGIQHNPALTGLQQRELAGWFNMNDPDSNYRPFKIPDESDEQVLILQDGETKYLVTTRINNINEDANEVFRSYKVKSTPGYVIGLQLLNPIDNRSSEEIWIYDSQNRINVNSASWNVKRDLTVFPTTSSSHGIVVEYKSGWSSLGGAVLVLSTIRAPIQDVYNRIVKGPVPTLTVTNSFIKNNQYGIHVSYYNRYLNELGDHFLRKSNESMKFINCEISHNNNEAFFIHSPHWDLHKSNISEIILMVNNSLVIDNGRGFYHFSRDMRASNNLFHYILQSNTIERNKAGGFDVNLPYVWQYNENFTHSIYMHNVTWRNNQEFKVNIDGHYAIVNITRNSFNENKCAKNGGLLSIKGMEKKLLINENVIEGNSGQFMVEFSTDSQSEIIGQVPARFIYNTLRRNGLLAQQTTRWNNFDGTLQKKSSTPSTIVQFKGIQKVNVNRNLFTQNHVDYQLIAGIKTAKVDSVLNVQENWWGSTNDSNIQNMIFDFDDWNNHAIANFRPYLVEESFGGSFSTSFEYDKSIDLDNLGGRLSQNLILEARDKPYIINSDITVMPKYTLTILPGVVMEFAPNVGILVLGSLKAKGVKGTEIIMRPLSSSSNYRKIEKRSLNNFLNTYSSELERFELDGDSIRLCKGVACSQNIGELDNEGFLEYFNKTTLQWIPMCDPRFTERNAQVVCRELGFDPLNAFFAFDRRIEFHSNSLSRIWSWPEPLQCTGLENKYEECPIRLNGQQFGHLHECKWDSNFVFIHCGKLRSNQLTKDNFWGGIRFADSEFEHHTYNNRIHDVHTHNVMTQEYSEMEHVLIEGAGILHNEKSPAVQSIVRSPKINYVTIKNSASHGMYIISPSETMNLMSNHIENSLGAGLNILSLTGEGREGQESSFTPLKDLNLPYNLFSLVNICDPEKEIRIEERVILYYKYDNHPVNCVKIFKSAYNVKPFGFRLLQFNLFNSTKKYGIPDFISLHDGDIYNVSSKIITRLTTDMKDEERKMFSTKESSLSVKLFANGASSKYGFIAEIVTLPISAIGFNREVQNNITNSVLINNYEGGLKYISAGEVHPIVTIDRNQFKNNGAKLYGNFTTSNAAIDIDIQNTQLLYFRNNLVENNQGGLSIKADARSSATSLKGYIHNNLFVNNSNHPALFVEGRKSSPYQEVTIYRNYFTRNNANFENNIVLKQVISNFTFNYVKRNIGYQNVEISGFDKVRLPIYQSTTHNGFYDNFATFRDGRSTIVAGTAGQHYVDNIFFNPDNDYEMITVNRSLFDLNSTLEVWKTKIDATHNYWGLNASLAVQGRIRDQLDDPQLLEVNYQPYHMNNVSVLNGKCPPGWDLVGDTCYIYIGAPMTFFEAKRFCEMDNATMPYIIGNTNYLMLYNFLKKQQQWFLYSDRVWVQDIDRINECTTFVYQSVETDNCERRSSFVCEIDPKVMIDPLVWQGDIITIAAIGSVAIAVLLIAIVIACWWSKSKYRHAQRLERRNSIRQSLHSLRSVGSTNGFSEIGYRRKPGQLSSRSTDTLTKASDYKKMFSEGSIDSMEKSTYTSSIEDNNSYEGFETNTNPSGYPVNKYSTVDAQKVQNNQNHTYMQPYRLAYKNEGFKDNSTFASNSNYQSQAESLQDASDNTPIVHSSENGAPTISYPPSEYYTNDTLPLRKQDSPDDSETNSMTRYYQEPKPLASDFLKELKNKMPQNNHYNQIMDLPSPPEPPRPSPPYSDKINNLQFSPPVGDYTTVGLPNVNYDESRPTSADFLDKQYEPQPRPRAKSEVLLETNFDYEEPETSQPLTEFSRSKSQPLETAM